MDDFVRAIGAVCPHHLIVDGNDMTFAVTADETETLELAERVESLPRPAGVRMLLKARGRFGFDDAGVGWEQGSLI